MAAYIFQHEILNRQILNCLKKLHIFLIFQILKVDLNDCV